MKDAFIRFSMNLLGVRNVKTIPLEEILKDRDIANEIQALELTTLKALFRYAGKELRRRL